MKSWIAKFCAVLICYLFLYQSSQAQYMGKLEEESQNILMHSSEFSIPISPAFDMLGVNPSLVPKPSIIRNFKVDWSFKTYGLTPNLALQTQPINEFYFNSPEKLKNYYKRSSLLKFLSTLDLSLGTVEGNNNIDTKQFVVKNVAGNDSLVVLENNWRIRSFAYAIKLNLYRQHDPLNEKKLFTRILKEYEEQKTEIKTQLREQQKHISESKDFEEKLSLREEAKSFEIEYNSLEDVYLERMRKLADSYKAEQWNSSYVDIAFGQLIDYDSRDSSLFRFKDLHVVNRKWALWINASKGFGKYVLLSGIIRITNTQNVLLNRNNTSVDIGANFRYGNHRYNLFLEGYIPCNVQRDEIIDNIIIGVGGDWRFSRNVILNYGIRTFLDKNYKFDNIVPVVSVSCIMR